MSGVASPAPSRSPTVAAGAIDGAQLAMRMVEAAERAADAAQAASALAAAAMAATGSSSPPAAKPTEWYKMLPKLNLQLFRLRAAKKSCQCFVNGFGSLSNTF